MPQSLAQVYIHTIFSTKDRHPFLSEPGLRSDVHAFMSGTAKSLQCFPIQIGGVADHVHLLTTLSRTIPISEFVKEVKRVSTNWIQDRGGAYAKFHWQSGYGAFSVSKSALVEVGDYIKNQEEHHRKVGFQDEFRRFLQKHEIDYDEKYVWD